MGKGKDMGEELSGMLRGVPPQNILIAFDDKPAKSCLLYTSPSPRD